MAEEGQVKRRRRQTKLQRHQRLKKIHRCIVLGLTIPEIADQIGCNERTVRRDLDADYERMERDGHREVAANRAAIMAELGRTYAEAVKDGEQARASERWGYLGVRIRAMALMARISGAEMPSRLIIQGQIGVKHTAEPAVQMIPQAELLRMAAIAAEVAAQAPAFRPGGLGLSSAEDLGTGNGNGNGNGNGQN